MDLAKILSYLPEMAFVAITVRIAALGAGIGDALAIIAIMGSIGYKAFLSKSKIDTEAEINKKIEDLASQVQSLNMDKALRRQVNEQKTPSTARKLF